MTDIISVLRKIVALEGKLAELYEWLGKVFADDRELGAFFFKLSLDEKQHRDLAAYQLKVAVKNRGMFGNVGVNVDHMENFIQRVDSFRSSAPKTPENAFKFVLQIENSLCEQYYATVMKESNEDVAALINTLSRECDNHYRECLEMAKKRASIG
jgi:rubrerythrin